jgi:histone-lysine N-methyltransferase SETMAR
VSAPLPPPPLAVTHTQGWGVRAAQAVPRGAFVCEYAGEWVSAAEAGRRLAVYDADAERGHALLVSA